MFNVCCIVGVLSYLCFHITHFMCASILGGGAAAESVYSVLYMVCTMYRSVECMCKYTHLEPRAKGGNFEGDEVMILSSVFECDGMLYFVHIM